MTAAPTSAALKARLAGAVARVAQALAADGGAIEIAEVSEDGDVSVRLTGACIGCPLRPLTMESLVRPALLEVPGVRRVELRGYAISEFAQERIRRAFAVGVPEGVGR